MIWQYGHVLIMDDEDFSESSKNEDIKQMTIEETKDKVQRSDEGRYTKDRTWIQQEHYVEEREWTKVWSEDDITWWIITVLQIKTFDNSVNTGQFRQMACFPGFHVSVYFLHCLH